MTAPPPTLTQVEILLKVHTFPYKLWLLDPNPPFELPVTVIYGLGTEISWDQRTSRIYGD